MRDVPETDCQTGRDHNPRPESIDRHVLWDGDPKRTSLAQNSAHRLIREGIEL